MAAETLLQTFFTRLGFETDTKGLDDYKDKIVSLSESLLKLSGVASLSLGGLFEFTRRATEPMAQIARMSETYGIATDTLAAFNRMGREVGITSEAMMGGLQNLNTAIAAVGIGQGRFLTKIAEQYGLKVRDANHNLKDMRTFLGDVAERMTTMSGMEQNLLVKRLGLAPEMVRLLRNGRQAFEEMYESMAKGLPFKDEDYRKAERFQIEFAKARGALGVISSQIALELMPLFQQAMEQFLTWWRSNGERVMERVRYWVGLFVDWGKNILTFIGRVSGASSALEVVMKALGAAVLIVVGAKLGGWAATAVEAIAGLIKPVQTVTTATKGLAAAQKSQAAASALATWQIWAIVAAIAILIGLVLLAIDDFETWKKGGESVIGSLMAWFDKGGKKAEQLRDLLKTVWTHIKSYFDWARETWAEAFDQMKKVFAQWWPDIKDGLILVGVLLGIALVAVVALGLGIVVLAGKVVTYVGKILEWLKKLWDNPKEALKELSDWLESVIVAIDNWLRELSGKGEEAIKNWVKGIGDWFVQGIKDMLNSAEKFITEWFNKWLGKIQAFGGKVKEFFTGKTMEITGEYNAPPILPTTAPATGPAFGPNVGARTPWVDIDSPITQNNTFHVDNMQEAVKGADELRQDLNKKQEQNLLAVAGAVVI